MRRLFAIAVVAAIILMLAVPAARAGIYCDVLRKLGYDNVKECEAGP